LCGPVGEEVRAVFERYGLHAVTIGRVTAEPLVRARAGDQPVCAVSGGALADDAPRYVLPAAPPADLEARRSEDLEPLAAEAPARETLLDLLASANIRSRKPVWRRYDHMNGTNTVVGPGAGDAAVLRIKGTSRAIAVALDGPGRLGALDPGLAAAAAVIESAANVVCSGARPIGITNCLNLGAPESPAGYWTLSETVAGLGEACRALDVPVVSGNVSLYNETPDGAIVPAALVGMIGLIEDRSRVLPMAWTDGDEIWLLGDPAAEPAALAASELAWRRGRFGGRPSLDLEAAARTLSLVETLAGAGLALGAHDLAAGGLGVALARMAIASGCGAVVALPRDGARWPTAALHGERAGRILVFSRDGAGLAAAARDAGVPALRLGTARSGELEIEAGGARLTWSLGELAAAWQQPL